MKPDELRTFDRALRWFLWTWLGRGEYEQRPGLSLEELLRLVRIGHRDHYPSRRALREHELGLAWLATQLRTEEARRIDAGWRSERSEVTVDVWADVGPGFRIAIGLATEERVREVLLGPEEAWTLVRQILGAIGRVRGPDEAGVRSDTVLVVNPLRGETWTEDER